MVRAPLLRWIWHRRRGTSLRYGFPRRGFPCRTDEGYNLVLLVVMITVMNIFMAKALPLWSQAIQRDKEAEMIFRGLQYAESIRVFQARYGQWPTKLKDLLEDKGRGRCARRLWVNPMVDESQQIEAKNWGWELIFEGQPVVPPQPRDIGLGEPSEQPGEGRNGRNGVERKIGPIIGVYSREEPEIIERTIQNWHFTVQVVQQQTVTPAGAFPTNSEDIGKPWPPGINLRNPQGVTGDLSGSVRDPRRNNRNNSNRNRNDSRGGG